MWHWYRSTGQQASNLTVCQMSKATVTCWASRHSFPPEGKMPSFMNKPCVVQTP